MCQNMFDLILLLCVSFILNPVLCVQEMGNVIFPCKNVHNVSISCGHSQHTYLEIYCLALGIELVYEAKHTGSSLTLT